MLWLIPVGLLLLGSVIFMAREVKKAPLKGPDYDNR